MLLKQTLAHNFIISRKSQAPSDAPFEIIDQALLSGAVQQFKRVLEFQSSSPPTSQWLELAQYECLQILVMMLTGRPEHAFSIRDIGIQKSLLVILRHRSGLIRLAAVRSLAVLVELPASDNLIFEALIDASHYALHESELDILLASLPALHAYYISHRSIPRQNLPRLFHLFAKVLPRRNRELDRVCLGIMREMTNLSLSPITISANEDGQSISLLTSPAKSPLMCAKLIFDMNFVLFIIKLVGSSNETLSREASFIFCNLLRLLPAKTEELIRTSGIQTIFDVLSIIYTSSSEPDFTAQTTYELLALLLQLLQSDRRHIEEILHLKTCQSSHYVQGVPLLILLSSSLVSDICSTAKQIMNCLTAESRAY